MPAKMAASLLLVVAAFAADPAPRRPVLLELFTSEGCSSCPPADRLLETFDRTQPVPGADLIVLSEHVDYWNRLGWADPYSSALFTERQQDYVNRFHTDSAYTPQLVVDGLREVVGSDAGQAKRAIAEAATYAKPEIGLSAQRSGDALKVAMKVAGAARGVNVYIVLAEDHAESRVTRGENSGRSLSHVAVVKTMSLAGKTDPQGGFVKDVTLGLQNGGSAAWRVVVFLQDSHTKQILGAAQTRV